MKNLPHLKRYVEAMGYQFEELGKSVGTVAPAGKCARTHFAKADSFDFECYDNCARDHFPELRRTLKDGREVRFYTTPAAGADAERGSMLYHASLWKDGVEIVPSESFIQQFAQQYPKTKFRHPLKEFDKLFQEAIAAVQPTSSPGASDVLGSTDGYIIENRLVDLQLIVFERLVLIASTPYAEIEAMTPREIVEQGYHDYVRLFLKKEVLKWSKMFDKQSHQPLQHPRYRIISNVSLVDQLIARMVYAVQNKKEIKNYDLISSMPGFGASADHSVQTFIDAHLCHPSRRQLLPHDDPRYVAYRCIDFQAWDWSVKLWQLMMDCDVRRACCDYEDDFFIAKCHRLISNVVFSLSNGELWAQVKPGMIKSGWYNTSASNSRIRCGVSKLFFGLLHWVIAMGDDSTEDDHPLMDQFCEWVNETVGQTIPDDDRLLAENGAVEFCSHLFRTKQIGGHWVASAELLTWVRTLAKFCYSTKKSAEQIAGIRQAMRHCGANLERIERFFERCYPELNAQSYRLVATDNA